MQCKDIPVLPILKFLKEHQGRWCTWGVGYSMPTVQTVMPLGTPEKVQLAKMRQLIKQKLVDGCDCGCRGDFEITKNGCEYIERTEQIAEPDAQGAAR